MSREIPLTKGKVAIVDDDDYERVMQHKWYCSNNGYAKRGVGAHGKIHQLLHRFIMNEPEGLQVDHRDGYRLNCRKENLRVCTMSQNGCNRGMQINNTSGRKGVTWCKKRKKWQAQITANGIHKYIGHFSSVDEAGDAYAKIAIELHGEFARVS
jgi:hypothetical protein